MWGKKVSLHILQGINVKNQTDCGEMTIQGIPMWDVVQWFRAVSVKMREMCSASIINLDNKRQIIRYRLRPDARVVRYFVECYLHGSVMNIVYLW